MNTASGGAGSCPLFDTVAIAGMGLIGGSLGIALRSRGLAGRVVGWVRREETGRQALALGAADEATQDGAGAVREADLVVLATPVRSMPALIESVSEDLRLGSIVTDAGSTKAYLQEAIPPLLPMGVRYVGGHPMAGSERAGIEAARADLFEEAAYVLTSADGQIDEPFQRLAAMAQGLGARPIRMTAEEHDRAVAWISHLPHVAAAALALAARRGSPSVERARELAAGGFRDSTRIAASPPEMWRDVCLTNAESLIAGLDLFEGVLREFRRAINARAPSELDHLLDAAAAARVEILAAGTSHGDR